MYRVTETHGYWAFTITTTGKPRGTGQKSTQVTAYINDNVRSNLGYYEIFTSR